jgi:threonine/homoserine/homoserine lactone efflux protein
MLEIFLFAFGIMYTPGPVNGLALMTGMTERLRSAILFCIGVGSAMTVLFVGISLLGSQFIEPWLQKSIGLCGGLYIGYLAYKLFRASGDLSSAKRQIGFKTGFIMQITNPKSMIVVLPVVGVLFPKAGLNGWHTIMPSVWLGFMAFGAPLSYLLLGWWMGKRIKPQTMLWVNKLMALLLIYLAFQFILPSVT